MKRTASPSSARSSESSVEHRRLHRDVERGGDLVADEQVGVRRERAGHRDALELAAGELAGEARREPRGQAHALEQAGDLVRAPRRA